jgi:hypothetical protein
MEGHAGDAPGFEILEGKAVMEMRPAGVNKGEAIAWLEVHFPDRTPLVFGDDVTDEDAFRVAQERGGDAILVAEVARPTLARWRLDGPDRVVALLRGLRHHGAGLQTTALGDERFHPIGDYGMIGDSRTAALVSPDASIDFLCVPRFDSPTVFASMLDPFRGGRWRISPTERLDVQRTYIGETNVLVTRFVRDGDPVLSVTDFLVYSRVNAFDPRHTGHLLLRRVDAIEDITVDVEFQPRFDYARTPTKLVETDTGLQATCGDEHLLLDTFDTALVIEPHEDGNGDVARGRIDLTAGERRWFQMRTRGSERGPHSHLSCDELFDLTIRTWGRWARGIDYAGPWRDDVVRSALVLKGLVYEPTGALVAAPTTSLPEGIGGERNWDYRYAWIRDSAYVLECFLRIGHTREAETFIRWLAELTEHIGGAHSLRRSGFRGSGEQQNDRARYAYAGGVYPGHAHPPAAGRLMINRSRIVTSSMRSTSRYTPAAMGVPCWLVRSQTMRLSSSSRGIRSITRRPDAVYTWASEGRERKLRINSGDLTGFSLSAKSSSGASRRSSRVAAAIIGTAVGQRPSGSYT